MLTRVFYCTIADEAGERGVQRGRPPARNPVGLTIRVTGSCQQTLVFSIIWLNDKLGRCEKLQAVGCIRKPDTSQYLAFVMCCFFFRLESDSVPIFLTNAYPSQSLTIPMPLRHGRLLPNLTHSRFSVRQQNHVPRASRWLFTHSCIVRGGRAESVHGVFGRWRGAAFTLNRPHVGAHGYPWPHSF